MEEYIKLAKEMALNNKCCNNSNFSVGAVLITKEDKIFTGCNIENNGIQSICAERCAFVKALSEGNFNFKSIIVMGKSFEDENFKKCVPCGYCRQFMNEYTDNEFKIYTFDEEENKLYEYTMNDLLPESFELEGEN